MNGASHATPYRLFLQMSRLFRRCLHLRVPVGNGRIANAGRRPIVPVRPELQVRGVATTLPLPLKLVCARKEHRLGLSVPMHPNTLAPRADHLTHAFWLGPLLPLPSANRLVVGVPVLPQSTDRPYAAARTSRVGAGANTQRP